MKNLHYTVTKDNKPQFRGSDFDCFEYILKHQPNSVDHATKYEGWKIQKTSLEGLIIERLLDGLLASFTRIGSFYSRSGYTLCSLIIEPVFYDLI